jgi:hypothetical protein
MTAAVFLANPSIGFADDMKQRNGHEGWYGKTKIFGQRGGGTTTPEQKGG